MQLLHAFDVHIVFCLCVGLRVCANERIIISILYAIGVCNVLLQAMVSTVARIEKQL